MKMGNSLPVLSIERIFSYEQFIKIGAEFACD